jgi:beta-phosphoglucomutase-like phosphatase (HAD superfamily)
MMQQAALAQQLEEKNMLDDHSLAEIHQAVELKKQAEAAERAAAAAASGSSSDKKATAATAGTSGTADSAAAGAAGSSKEAVITGKETATV